MNSDPRTKPKSMLIPTINQVCRFISYVSEEHAPITARKTNKLVSGGERREKKRRDEGEDRGDTRDPRKAKPSPISINLPLFVYVLSCVSFAGENLRPVRSLPSASASAHAQYHSIFITLYDMILVAGTLLRAILPVPTVAVFLGRNS